MRLFRRRSFAHKITLAALLATSIAVSALMSAVLILDSISSRTLLNARLATLADVVGQNSTAALAFNDPTAAVEVLGALRAEPPVVTACLYDLSERLFAQYQRNKDTLSCPTARALVPAPSRKYPNIMHSIFRRGEVVGTVVLISDIHELEQRRKSLLLLGGLLLALALAIGGVSASVLQRKISRPILDLSSAMQKVTAEKVFSARVTVEGTDEIARLGDGFNSMLHELERRESEKQEFEAKLKFQALNDPLTGLPNRRLFGDRLAQALAGAERGKLMLALLYIDLDGFKLVNDSLGHPIGDSLLVQVSTRLRAHVRKSDTLARLGGDEFTVVLTSINAKEGAMIAAKKFLDALAAPFIIEEHELTVGASIGISLYPESGLDTSALMQQADSAMYAAKRNGKNQAMYFTPDLGALVRERLNIENQLREALKRSEIHAHYQPEFDVVSGQLVRFEALARWTHRTLGIITPDRFIPVAEESGLIVPLGAHILEQACMEAVRWNAIAPYPVQVAVNVSSVQFARVTFVDEVIEILNRTGLKPNLLQLELTESVMISGIHHSVEAMKRLKGLGITFAIDDFGTGYSCLSYLSVLPFDALKVDRSFVRESKLREDGRMLLESLINLAHNMGLRVIAEGVENIEQLDLIRNLGGSEVQGYLLGRPIPDPMLTVSSLCRRGLPAVNEALGQRGVKPAIVQQGCGLVED
jgi:diguanylate cyclase (GGDEF)-like protein